MRGFFCTNSAVKNRSISIYHNVPLSEQSGFFRAKRASISSHLRLGISQDQAVFFACPG